MPSATGQNWEKYQKKFADDEVEEKKIVPLSEEYVSPSGPLFFLALDRMEIEMKMEMEMDGNGTCNADGFTNRDIQVLKTYGAAPYAAPLKKLEKDIKELQTKVNEKIGTSPSISSPLSLS